MTRINTMVVPLMVLIATAMVGIVQSASLPSSNDWTNLNYMKQFDLTGSTSHTITTITIKSSTPSYASDTTIPYYFLLSSTDANHLSWTRLTLKPALDSPLASNSDYKGGLRPVLDLIPLGPIDNDPTTHIYSADIPVNVLGTDATTTLTLETTLNHITQPLPKTVKQTQPQLLLWSGDSTIRSPYSTNSGRIKVKCASPKIISFSPSDATKSGSIVTFGPFSNLPAYIPGSTNVPIGKVHFQTDTPQATIVSLERIAEISHWGDAVSITDRILLRNTDWKRFHFEISFFFS
uniref:Dolichyl-diphosphooligosaccharide--protein glycosyltransferase subunit 1 n=1 Tax=Melanopsichium pennsylvanicum 4 TaxID=1398559 RepID=A0A077QZK4_9BASI|nr:related to Dolichyl-diphosphooligosaccharide--protein glycosyltransferase 67 kDa subunit precursor [Melanopsichium pennsylvanicum 4]